jgi:hypothetical protein
MAAMMPFPEGTHVDLVTLGAVSSCKQQKKDFGQNATYTLDSADREIVMQGFKFDDSPLSRNSFSFFARRSLGYRIAVFQRLEHQSLAET